MLGSYGLYINNLISSRVLRSLLVSRVVQHMAYNSENLSRSIGEFGGTGGIDGT
jgi:hypothetical protein